LPNNEFTPGDTYENVYFIVADATGYSSIVLSNPRDRAAHAFDLLRERVVTRVQKLSAELDCARIGLWSWRGDGGLIAIHDDDESTTRDVALRAALDILLVDLREVREQLSSTELNGELRLRIAVHKGTIPYSPNGDNGSIHSPEVNFVAHLEEVTPPDCVTISEDVHRAAGPHAGIFTHVGNYERREVYMRAVDTDPSASRRAWLTHNGLSGKSHVTAHVQRPSQHEKARLLDVAREDIVDLGTALRTAASYLNTTERPATYRDATLEFLARGGTYRCVMLDPACETTATLTRYRGGENLADKIRNSVKAFSEFKERHGAAAENLHVYYTKVFPGFSAIAVDIDSDSPLVLYSPYLMSMTPLGIHPEHSDTPHYLATPGCPAILNKVVSIINPIATAEQLERIL
jgi:class 3 adenylate cyclase